MGPEDLHEEWSNEEEQVNHEVDQEKLLCGLKLFVDDVSDDWGLVAIISEFLVDLEHVICHFKLSYI